MPKYSKIRVTAHRDASSFGVMDMSAHRAHCAQQITVDVEMALWERNGVRKPLTSAQLSALVYDQHRQEVRACDLTWEIVDLQLNVR